MKKVWALIACWSAACGGAYEDLDEAASMLSAPAGLPASIAAGGRESIAPGTRRDVACPANRWIGYLISGPNRCPLASSASWQRAKLFPGATIGSDLDRYCVYNWSGASAPNIATLPAPSPEIRLERDCRVVARLAAANPGISFEAGFADKFLDAFDAQADQPIWREPQPSPLDRVHVALIDTSGFSAHASNDGGISNHSITMAEIIRHVACWDGRCSLTEGLVVPYAGLPRAPWPRAAADGGIYGSHADVAIAIWSAVNDWINGPHDTQNLVINLSLGWDATYGNETRVTARSVWDVLREASCAGALNVAAAGNRSGAARNVMYPAAWESDPVRCNGVTRAPGAYDPLVHAVGATDGRDRLLQIARPNAVPRLVATAAHFPGRPDQEPAVYASGVMSGSSIAAALTSGTAAAVWRLDPDLAPHEVMTVIYGQAPVIAGLAATFGQNDRARGAVRRVSVCKSILAACNKRGLNCALSCGRRAASADATLSWPIASNIYAAPAQPAPLRRSTTSRPAFVATALSQEIDPYVFTQPGTTGCPLCYLTPNNEVRGEIRPEDGELKGVEIEVKLDDGRFLYFDGGQPERDLDVRLEIPAGRRVYSGAVLVYTQQGEDVLVSSSELLLPKR